MSKTVQTKYPFTCTMSRDKKIVRFVMSGYIWPEGRNASAEVAAKLAEVEEGDEVELFIRNLYGGDVDEGLTIYHDFKAYKPTVKVDGLVASMGTVIMLAGPELPEFSEHSKAMTHRPQGGMVGDPDQMAERAQQMKEVEDEMAGIYAAATGLTTEEAKAKFMVRGKDTIFPAKEALKVGLCGKVTKGSLLRGTVAVKDLKGVTDPDEYIGRFAACMTQTPAEKGNTMTMKKTTMAALGLKEGAGEDEVNAKVDALLTENEQLKEKLRERDEADAKREGEELEQGITAALTANKITKAVADDLRKQGKEAPRAVAATLKTMLGGMPAHASITDAVRTAGQANAANTLEGKLAERSAWTLMEWSKKDPKGLLQLKQEKPDVFAALKQASK